MATLIYDGEPYAVANTRANDLCDQLARKLDHPEWITTVRGVGYRFRE